MTVSEKSIYIKGYIDALSLDPDSAVAKAIKTVCDFCGELAAELQRQSVRAGGFEKTIDDMKEYVDAIDSDLCAIEDVLLPPDDDDDPDDADEAPRALGPHGEFQAEGGRPRHDLRGASPGIYRDPGQIPFPLEQADRK